ncbi:MAG: hypothetical protein WD688_04255 [Candidatus Binatia bacterium]
MRLNNLTLAALFSVGFLGMSALQAAGADDGILLKVRAGDSNYCHLKFPAIQEETLSWGRPVLKPGSTSDIVDFYGPCNFDPTGKEAVQAQQRDHYDTVTNNE